MVRPRTSTRLWLFLLFVPALCYVLVAVVWQRLEIYKIYGDEPHYLLVSESLIRDGDVVCSCY